MKDISYLYSSKIYERNCFIEVQKPLLKLKTKLKNNNDLSPHYFRDCLINRKY